MRNDGTAMWSLAVGIRILHWRRCTGGLWRATTPRTITPYWAKSPRNFETPIRPACGRASPFRGRINTNKSTGKDRFAATPRLTGKPAVRSGRSEEMASRWLAVSEEAGWFFPMQIVESMGYCGCYVGLGDSGAKSISYNKRTMDPAMGPFWPLWHFLESISYVLSIP